MGDSGEGAFRRRRLPELGGIDDLFNQNGGGLIGKLGSEIMKRLMGFVLAALLLAVFVFQFRRVLARAPEGGSPVLWILAFAVVVGLIALVGGVLRKVNFSRLR